MDLVQGYFEKSSIDGVWIFNFVKHINKNMDFCHQKYYNKGKWFEVYWEILDDSVCGLLQAQMPSRADRLEKYDVPPLRLDMTAHCKPALYVFITIYLLHLPLHNCGSASCRHY